MTDRVKFKAFPTAFKLAKSDQAAWRREKPVLPLARKFWAFRANSCMTGARLGSCMGQQD